jgi:hypothetical protein
MLIVWQNIQVAFIFFRKWNCFKLKFGRARARMNIKTDVQAAAILFALAKIRKSIMNISNSVLLKQIKDLSIAMETAELISTALMAVMSF